jgi:translation initiation factor 2A
VSLLLSQSTSSISEVYLLRSNTGETVFHFPVPDVNVIKFSPLGNYLITWSHFKSSKTPGAVPTDNNMRVWLLPSSRSSAICVYSFQQKVYKEDAIQFTSDEQYIFRAVSNEIQVLRTADLVIESSGDIVASPSLTSIAKVYQKGISQYLVSSSHPSAGRTTCFIAAFTPEISGKPAAVVLHSLSYSVSTGEEVIDGPISSRTVFAATEVSMAWNAPATCVLIHTHCDVDKSNSSYYGSSGLFYMTTDSTLAAGMVPLSKEGAVHDVKWSPIGDRFAVCAGHMPAQSTLFNASAAPVFEFGCAHRNTVSWSPHGRFLCLAGFGNLAGEMDFYDLQRMKKCGSNSSHCAVQYGWSPDSRYFMT